MLKLGEREKKDSVEGLRGGRKGGRRLERMGKSVGALGNARGYGCHPQDGVLERTMHSDV